MGTFIILTNKFAGNGSDVGDKWYVNINAINSIRACKAMCLDDKDFSTVYTDNCIMNVSETAEEIYEMIMKASGKVTRCMKEDEADFHYFKGE